MHTSPRSPFGTFCFVAGSIIPTSTIRGTELREREREREREKRDVYNTYIYKQREIVSDKVSVHTHTHSLQSYNTIATVFTWLATRCRVAKVICTAVHSAECHRFRQTIPLTALDFLRLLTHLRDLRRRHRRAARDNALEACDSINISSFIIIIIALY